MTLPWVKQMQITSAAMSEVEVAYRQFNEVHADDFEGIDRAIQRIAYAEQLSNNAYGIAKNTFGYPARTITAGSYDIYKKFEAQQSTVGKLISLIKGEIDKAIADPRIKKPFSHTLYRIWCYVKDTEKERA